MIETVAETIDLAYVQAVLDLSDERDLWMRRVSQAWRDGWLAGMAAGYRAGFSQAVTEWKVTAGGMTHLGGESFAEVECRRYGPGGRASFGRSRPGDFKGRAEERKAS